MTWLRRLVWLVVVAAFACPPALASPDGMAASASAGIHDCHDAPPPPCPESSGAKHAAGLCCPLMSLAVAVLPRVATLASPRTADRLPLVAGRHLAGLSPHEEPPPPRV
jgi:hypothetical protein